MRAIQLMTVLALVASLLVVGAPVAGEEAVFSYVGADGCKLCHKSEAKGDQFGKWAASKHAKAYEVLGTEEAKAVAAKAGLEGNPQELDQCLQCHVTAHGVAAERLGPKFVKTEGVGCESCHGPGSEYKKKSVMESREASIAAGMVVPNEATCKTCHNEKSPTFKGFKYDEMLAKIAHPYPKDAPAAAGE